MRQRPSTLQIAGALCNWTLWLLIACLVLAQLLSLFWNSMTWVDELRYGRSPSEGLHPIPGTNDEAYSDRSFVCVLQGRSYVPMSVNEALAMGTTKIVDTTGAAVDGYRVVRRCTATLVSEALASYTTMCSVLSVTIDEILKTCSTLGYDVIFGDNLRIVGDLNSNTMQEIPNSLPILVMPFWDNSPFSRSSIPGQDGSACMVRLDGSYLYSVNPVPVLYAVNRTVREAKTIEFLKRPGGRWKNGWYEDLSGMKWYSDVISSGSGSTPTSPQTSSELLQQEFNMRTGERACSNELLGCPSNLMIENWGSVFSFTGRDLSMTSVVIANGERYGIFLYEGIVQRRSKFVYNWETLLSNVLTAQILLRWMAAMTALQRGYFLRVSSSTYTIGLSSLANSTQFRIFPVMLLPRMKMTLFAFWSSGCQFEGQQQPFSYAWFLIYPTIVEVVICYYSLLNTLGRLLRFRICDKLFGVSVILLCSLHYFRKLVATSGWFPIDGRISTEFYADELDELTLVQLFTTGVALRINGNVMSIFYAKIVILAINLVPVLLRRSNPASSETVLGSTNVSRIETIIAASVHNAGGLGAHSFSRKYSTISPMVSDLSESPSTFNPYELTRLGYFIYGNVLTEAEVFLIAFDDWLLVTQLAPLRKLTSLWNHQVLVFPISIRAEDRVAVLADEPEMCCLDDPRLQGIRWWHFHVQSITYSPNFQVEHKRSSSSLRGPVWTCPSQGENPPFLGGGAKIA